jgi:glycerophosphoinositol inositolphosphodiesterase
MKKFSNSKNTLHVVNLFFLLIDFIIILSLYDFWDLADIEFQKGTGKNFSIIGLLLIILVISFLVNILGLIQRKIEKKEKTQPQFKIFRIYKIISIISLIYAILLLLTLYGIGFINKTPDYSILEVSIKSANVYTYLGTSSIALFLGVRLIFYSKTPKSHNVGIKRYKIKKIVSFCFIILLFFLPIISVPIHIGEGDLPPKPLLIAHRGVSSLVPENTLESYQLAAELGCDGIEVDIQISWDGILFMMHDGDLKRTTNVEQIFPNRSNDHPSTFLWAELQELDAGSWFEEEDPFGSVISGKVNSSQINSYKLIKIPALQEVIDLCVKSQMIIDMDYKGYVKNHPYNTSFHTTIRYMLLNSTLPNQSLVWDRAHPLVNNHPGIKILGTHYGTLDEWKERGEDIIDAWHDQYHYSKIKEFCDAGVFMFLHVVDEEGDFSRYWSFGVNAIMTDTPQKFINLSAPIYWYMSFQEYYLLWGSILGTISLLMVIIRLKMNFNSRKKSEIEKKEL